MNTFKTTACVLSIATAGFAMDMCPGGGDDGDENFNPNKFTRSAPSTPVKAKRPVAEVATPQKDTQTNPDFMTPVRQPRVQQVGQDRQYGVDNVGTLLIPRGTTVTSLMAQIDAYNAAHPARIYTDEELARLRFNPDGSSCLEAELPTIKTTVHFANFSNEMVKLLKAYKAFLSFASKVFSPKAFEILKNMKAKDSTASVSLATPVARDVLQTPNAPERSVGVVIPNSLRINQLGSDIGTPFAEDDLSIIHGDENRSENSDLDSEYGSVISGVDDDEESVGLNTGFRIDFGSDDEEDDDSEDGSVYDLEDPYLNSDSDLENEDYYGFPAQ
jgi:hypothetical protein